MKNAYTCLAMADRGTRANLLETKDGVMSSSFFFEFFFF